MHKKKLYSAYTTAYAAMCMVRDIVNAYLCKGIGNYSLLDNLIDTFENVRKEMNGYCDRELVWVLGE